METLRKPLAVILGLTAVAVLLHFVLSPFYDDVVESGDVWNVLNWFMAFGVIVALVLTYLAKRDVGREDDTNTYIRGNVGFYAAAALAILYFWNWFNELVTDDGSGTYWVLIDTIYVILVTRVSIHLWRDSSSD
ncbi:MAG: hypothetical protein OXK79_08860 [Chloroflexota bacterium]|nr:hypothetical protein [Chloroflexota bacterium]